MESLFIYATKASGILLFFYFTYVLILKKETLFHSHRWFFHLGLLTSIILPLFYIHKSVLLPKATTLPTIHSFAKTSQVVQAENFSLDWTLILSLLYFAVTLFFFIRYTMAIATVQKIISTSKAEKLNNYMVHKTTKNIPPFSFFSKIVLNPNSFSSTDLNAILQHEATHCREKHTFDILFVQLYCAIFWWNPFVWMYKKQLLLNLEYIADQQAILQFEDKKAYQFLLLKSIQPNSLPAVANSFFQSPLKNRIIMMNTKPSKKTKAWKYMLILPVLILFVGIFQIRYVAQENEVKTPKAQEKISFLQESTYEIEKPIPPSNEYLKDMPKPPVNPNIEPPEAPKIQAPKNPYYEAGWAKYNAIMEKHVKEMAVYEKNMEPYYKALEEYEKQMEPFYKKMDEFEIKFAAYEKELDAYYKQFDSEFDKQYEEYEKSKKAK